RAEQRRARERLPPAARTIDERVTAREREDVAALLAAEGARPGHRSRHHRLHGGHLPPAPARWAFPASRTGHDSGRPGPGRCFCQFLQARSGTSSPPPRATPHLTLTAPHTATAQPLPTPHAK